MNSLSDSILSLLLNPNIIFLLFIVALIGIFVEITHPGAIVPGVVGSIGLILFIFGSWMLSPNWAGLLLMALAFGLLLLDVKLAAHGILTLGAVLSLIFGTFLFFNSGQPSPKPEINPILVFAMGGLVGCIGLYIVTLVARSRRRAVKSGTDSMIGATVIASTPLQPVGRVNYKGEDWTAILDDPSSSVDPGTEVLIVGVEGLLLHVRPVIDTLSDAAQLYIEGS